MPPASAAGRPAQLGDVAPVDQHRPAGHAAAAAVSEQGHPDGGLAAAGLADQAEYLPSLNLDADLVDHVVARAGELDPQVADLDRRGVRRCERAHAFALRSSPIAARAIPSVTRLVPTVSRPMAATGSSTPHGCTLIASRFSLIISPQSAVGGCSPKPRKLIAATRPIE